MRLRDPLWGSSLRSCVSLLALHQRESSTATPPPPAGAPEEQPRGHPPWRTAAAVERPRLPAWVEMATAGTRMWSHWCSGGGRGGTFFHADGQNSAGPSHSAPQKRHSEMPLTALAGPPGGWQNILGSAWSWRVPGLGLSRGLATQVLESHRNHSDHKIGIMLSKGFL